MGKVGQGVGLVEGVYGTGVVVACQPCMCLQSSFLLSEPATRHHAMPCLPHMSILSRKSSSILLEGVHEGVGNKQQPGTRVCPGQVCVVKRRAGWWCGQGNAGR